MTYSTSSVHNCFFFLPMYQIYGSKACKTLPEVSDGEINVAWLNLIETLTLLSIERRTGMKINTFSFVIKAA